MGLIESVALTYIHCIMCETDSQWKLLYRTGEAQLGVCDDLEGGGMGGDGRETQEVEDICIVFVV